ncbi:sensory box histidine kinase/response regulator [Halorhodospira halochloris]|uniref:histidine kinase n=1 Tax=Halorhodospira halochloris TaxID=1052 RepID=A0A110B5V2_HALHR|nr:response regulator [Halorhodospira halochloris]MBK1651739.1 hypothetical protein [Halorhodospira halochloris]BAU58603.1 sensory box histidine kinase/response regulator [Halorhodospira halochloris]
MAGQHQQALQESEQRFQIATEAAGIGVWELDLETGRFQWNSYMFSIFGIDGVKESEPDYESWKQMLLPEDRQRMERVVRDSARHGEGWELVFRAQRRDGEIRYIRAVGRQLYDCTGVPRKAFGINEDITQKKEAEWAREQAERERREFLAAVSHDLRTPLSALIGLNDLLSETDLDEQQRHYLNLSRTAGETLLARINTILDLSRLEAGKVELFPEPFDLRNYLSEQVALLRTLADRKGLELELVMAEDLPKRVYGDATRLGQVIYNLTSNAIKFTDEGGVWINVAPSQQGQIKVSVADTGPGIAPEDQKRVFLAFTQAGGVDKRKEGSGLGLRICRELARLMGGDVVLESTVGHGSVFTFTATLPKTEEQSLEYGWREGAGSSANSATYGSCPDGAERLDVVVAEDDPTNALMLCELLKGFNCHPVHVENGLDALDQWSRLKPDLLLLDLQMPGADGRTVAYQVRQIEAANSWRRTTVAILTAYPPSELERICEQVDCDQLLHKPIDKLTLQRLIDSVREQKRLLVGEG